MKSKPSELDKVPLEEFLDGERAVTPRLIGLLQQPLAEALEQTEPGPNGTSLRAFVSGDCRTITVEGNADESGKVRQYGLWLRAALNQSGLRLARLETIARDCANGRIADIAALRLRLERRVSSFYFIILLAILAICLAALYFLSHL